MKSRETRPEVMDGHYGKCTGFVQQVDAYYRSKSDEELKWMRAELVRESQMLGNIPLLASTTPIVFLIFGSQVSKYFPHDSLRWMLVALLSILIIVWSINHHFRKKGRVHLDIYLLEQIQKDRSQKDSPPVQ